MAVTGGGNQSYLQPMPTPTPDEHAIEQMWAQYLQARTSNKGLRHELADLLRSKVDSYSRRNEELARRLEEARGDAIDADQPAMVGYGSGGGGR